MGGDRLWEADVRRMAGFALRVLLSEWWGTLSLRYVARLMGAAMWRVMAGFCDRFVGGTMKCAADGSRIF